MLVRALSPAPSSYSSLDDRALSPLRPFHIPRIKNAATALLRHGHGYLTPSGHQQQQHTAALKHQNSLRSACNVPDEVLSKVFFACAEFSLADQVSDASSDGEAWSWVNVSYVCTSWRRVALATQEIWSYIDFSSHRWWAVTLGRAKMLPLRIKAAVTDQNIRQLHRTLQLAHRIREVHLTAPIQRIHPLLEILAHPNPALETLIVAVSIPLAHTYIDAYDPPTFPTSGLPLKNLKYMELHGAPFYLLSSRCMFLTHFHLHDLPFTERPTLRYFLFMLEGLKHLEYLTLDRSFPINLDLNDVQSLERRISLPKLKSLSLVGSVPEIANILECVMLPPSARLVARICTLPDLKDCIGRLSQSLRSHSWGATDGLPLETLVLTGQESAARFMPDSFATNANFRQTLRLRAFRADCDRGGAAIDVTIEPFESHADDDLVVTTLAAIWKALALSQIHTLALQDVDIVTQKSWSQFLRTIPSLRVLDITGLAPSGLVWALLLNARSHGQVLKGQGDIGGDQRLFIPNLNDIYLHKVDCSSGGFMVSRTAHVNSHCDLDDSRFLDVLTACLFERRRFGLCLRSLSIARCEFVVRKSVEAARGAVSYLICDFRNLVKDEDVDETSPARYRSIWNFEHPQISHYYRLRTLVQLDSESDF